MRYLDESGEIFTQFEFNHQTQKINKFDVRDSIESGSRPRGKIDHGSTCSPKILTLQIIVLLLFFGICIQSHNRFNM